LAVEDTSKRDVFSSVWRNVDGSETLELSSEPLNFADESGDWQKVDHRVIAGSDGVLTNAANEWSVRFDRLEPGRGVSFESSDGLVRFWPENVTPVSPVVEPPLDFLNNLGQVVDRATFEEEAERTCRLLVGS
jgi:hypothetical protein